jgi:hypothetical protein
LENLKSVKNTTYKVKRTNVTNKRIYENLVFVDVNKSSLIANLFEVRIAQIIVTPLSTTTSTIITNIPKLMGLSCVLLSKKTLVA